MVISRWGASKSRSNPGALMSHMYTTPAIAIAELQGQLADAKTEVADSLSYLTDCRTTVAASSFATPDSELSICEVLARIYTLHRLVVRIARANFPEANRWITLDPALVAVYSLRKSRS